MASVLRGEIRWAELDPTFDNEQQGTRPVLIISHDVFNERSGTVLAMTITSQPQRAGFPLTLPLGKLGGKVGGKARAAKLTPEQQSEIGKKAAAARWKDK